MATGVSNYTGRSALDTVASNLPDTSGTNMSGSGNPDRAQSALLDVHSQAIAILEAFLGTGSTTTPPGGGQTIVSNAAGTSDWAAVPAGTPATEVIANTTYARGAAVGFGIKFARDAHDHGMPGPIKEVYFPFAAVTSPTTGTYKYRVKVPSTLLSVRAVLGTVASTGADAIFDVNKNGTSMISSGKPQITVGQSRNTNAQTFATTSLTTDDVVSVDIDQGSDGFQAGVIVELQENSPVGATPVGIDLSWGPTDQGFLGWTLDPAGEIGGATILTTGVVYIGAIAVRRPITVTNVWCAVSVLGSGLVASQSFLGLYSSAGTLLSATATMVTDFGSTGVKSKALTTPQAVGPGIYYVAVVSNGTTPPTLARGVTNVTALAALHNQANESAATARFASNGTGTTLPASLTMANNVTTGQVNFWFAIS